MWDRSLAAGYQVQHTAEEWVTLCQDHHLDSMFKGSRIQERVLNSAKSYRKAEPTYHPDRRSARG